ncbi:MAG TPA: ATP synthase F1 subunit epsilon [Thermoanaerobaculaceae bacterium]|nr:ATP synthase F1 subunit epsilon [Thermoanaerobaculaceae bacterium]
MSGDRLRLKVVTPTRVVVDSEADSVTVPAALGALGILPGHAPLLAALRIGELSYHTGTREHYMAVQNGFVEVTSDPASDGGGGTVTVLADVAELPSEIDMDAAKAEKASAEAALKSAAGKEFDRHQAMLEGAVTRIAVAKRR